MKRTLRPVKSEVEDTKTFQALGGCPRIAKIIEIRDIGKGRGE
jgi:hypothetical protein